MINIVLNGTATFLETETPLKEALSKWGYEGEYFAVAMNHRFIPRNLYEDHFIKDGDTIEIVAPMQGG